MAAIRGSGLLLKRFIRYHSYSRKLITSKQLSSITGYARADEVINNVTAGRIDNWLKKYEDMVGLTEIKEAQEKVIRAESNLLKVQAERRQRQQEMAAVQTQLKQISMDLDKVQRGDERYLKLLTEEHGILKEESSLTVQLNNYEDKERLLFAELSSAVRESHEKERARSDRTKYWSIIGSIIGAMIGILGTSINNYLRMRELRGLVRESTAGGTELQIVVAEVAETVYKQHDQMMAFTQDLKAMLGADTTGSQLEANDRKNLNDSASKSLENVEVQTKNILVELGRQDNVLQKELASIKNMVSLSKVDDAGNVVFIGSHLEDMLNAQNKNIEWKIKMNALWTVTLIYGAFALTLPVLYSIFKGG